MKNNSSNWPTLCEWLRVAVTEKDLGKLEFGAEQATPNQLIQFHQEFPELGNEALTMLWSVCVSWAQEVAWVYEHSLPEEERELENLPSLDTLTPDLPLSQHRRWSPLDHLDRLGGADAVSQLWAEVTRKGATDV